MSAATTLSTSHSEKGLTKKASLNAVAASIDYAARALTGFVISPLLVTGLGSYLFGTWQILGNLVGYLSAAGGRPSQALKWTIATRHVSADHAEKRRSVGSAVAVWILFLPILVLVGAPLAWLTPTILGAPAELFGSIRFAAGLLVTNLVLVGLADIPQSVLQGENLGYKRMGLSATLVFVGGGITALALYFETGIAGVALANLANTILSGVLFLTIVRSYVPWFAFAAPSFAEIRRFAGLSCWFLAWRLVNRLMMASDAVLLGLFSSVELVATYTLTKYTPEILVSVVAIVVGGICPGLGGIIGAGNREKAASVRGEITLMTWLLSTAIGMPLVIWNQSFVRLWVGEEHYAGSLPTVLIMFMVVQLVLIRNDAFIIDLTLDLRPKVILGALAVSLSAAVAGVLIRFFQLGILGLCIGFMVGRLLLTFGYPWVIGRFLGIPLGRQLRRVIRPALATLLLSAASWQLANHLLVASWIGLIASAALSLPASLILAFYMGLSSTQRRQILARVQRLAPRLSHG